MSRVSLTVVNPWSLFNNRRGLNDMVLGRYHSNLIHPHGILFSDIMLKGLSIMIPTSRLHWCRKYDASAAQCVNVCVACSQLIRRMRSCFCQNLPSVSFIPGSNYVEAVLRLKCRLNVRHRVPQIWLQRRPWTYKWFHPFWIIFSLDWARVQSLKGLHCWGAVSTHHLFSC